METQMSDIVRTQIAAFLKAMLIPTMYGAFFAWTCLSLGHA